MSFDEINSHIENYEYRFAQEKLLDIINGNESEVDIKILALEKFFAIQNNFEGSYLPKVFLPFFDYLVSNNYFGYFVEYFERIYSEKDPSFLLYKDYLHSLWEIGQVKKYNDCVLNYGSSLVIDKRWNLLDEFLTIVEGKIKVQTSLLISLSQALECNENDKAAIIISEYFKRFILVKDITKAKSCLAKLYQFIEHSDVDEANLYLIKLRVKILNRVLSNQEITDRDKIEFLLLANDDLDYRLLLEVFDHRDVGDFVSKHLPTTRRINLFPFLKNKKIEKIKVEKISSKNQTLDIENLEILTSKDDIELSVESVQLISEFEKNIFMEIEQQNLNSEQLHELITSLMLMDLNQVARKLLVGLEESVEHNYLLAEVSLRINDFSSVIYYCNKTINDFKLLNEDLLPFLKLKAEAFKIQNKDLKARDTYKEIIKIDPDYLNAKRKL